MRKVTSYKDKPELADQVIPYLCKGRKIMVYDSYNSRFPCDQRICGTVVANFSRNAPKNGYKIVEIEDFTYRVRKVLPKECFKLMGVSESDFLKIENSGISKTQQYKLAGNSIVVDVMARIFGKLLANSLFVSAKGLEIPPPVQNASKLTKYQPEEYLRVPQATAKGYVDVPPHSIFDGSYINSKTRRGRVQEGGSVSPTITCSSEPLNVYEGIKIIKGK